MTVRVSVATASAFTRGAAPKRARRRAPGGTRRRGRCRRYHIAEAEPRIRTLATAIARAEGGDADELVQIAFKIALRRLSTFKPGKGLSFYSYIYRPVRAATNAAGGRDAPVETFDEEACGLAVADLTTPEDLVVEAAEREERRRHVRAALETTDRESANDLPVDS